MKKWIGRRSTIEATLILSAACLAAFLVLGAGLLFVQDMTRWGKFPPRSSVAGVDVSGLSPADAEGKCRKELADVASKPIVLEVGERKISITAREIGLHLDYTNMVQEAHRESWSANIVERMFRSMVNRQKDVSGAIIAQNNDELAAGFVRRATAAGNQPPVNAYVDVTSGNPVIKPSRDGYSVTESQVKAAVLEAENSKSRTVLVPATKVPAALNDSIFGRLIVVNLSEHTLYLYDREKPVAQFGIACGMPEWPTPVGQWQIIGKQMNPTWTNPHSAWSSGMPETIGPGYSNPLGVRAMPLNASGVLIHGTSNDGSIGTSASHGCMRMHMPDVIKLFDMVQVNTPVYIIHGAGNPGFDVAKTPKWRLPGARQAAPSYSGN